MFTIIWGESAGTDGQGGYIGLEGGGEQDGLSK